MEKSRSFPQYSLSSSSSYSVFGYEEGSTNSYSFNGRSGGRKSGSSGGGGGGFASAMMTSGDRELKRKKRVASYNVLTMEGKFKSSVRNGFKWIKSKFTDDVDGA